MLPSYFPSHPSGTYHATQSNNSTGQACKKGTENVNSYIYNHIITIITIHMTPHIPNNTLPIQASPQTTAT